MEEPGARIYCVGKNGDGIKKTPHPTVTSQKPPISYLTPAKPVGEVTISAVETTKADIECYHCHDIGHYANACPQRTAKGEANEVTSPESPKQLNNSQRRPVVKSS